MYTGEKLTLRPRSFHHRIREGGRHYIDTDQFLGIDPFDKTKFYQVYEPAINVKENDDIFELEIMVPGFRKEEIMLQVEGNDLVIYGEKNDSSLKGNEHYIHSEQVITKFERCIDLGTKLDAAEISAEMEHGILHVTLKKLDPKSENLTIEIH